MNFDPQPYEMTGALLHWLIVFGGCLAIAFAVGLVVSLLGGGKSGLAYFARQVTDGVRDLAHFSSRRIWALAMLTFKEAVRRKALLVFVVFAVLFMFAGWFITDTGLRPEMQTKNYISFVLKTVSWLILPVMLLLSCWGVPEDIRTRSLHTVVTKPVRRSEIVMGRMLGFTIVGTLVLTFMGIVGYVWILRESQARPEIKEQLISRVPVYGSLKFVDREGSESTVGKNVGDIWDFRSYIEGASRARAIWDFEGGLRGRLGDHLVLEQRFEAFRTHRGRIDDNLLAQYTLIDETGETKIPLPPFEVAEFREDNLTVVNRDQSDGETELGRARRADGDTLYLHPQDFDNLVSGEKLRVEVSCLDSGQFLGMARPDLFIRLPDRPFESGFFKAIFGIWLMMTLIVVLGVTASCFVKGPVATLLTFTFLIVGFGFGEFMGELVAPMEGGETISGGGPLEATYRILTQTSLEAWLDEDWKLTVLRNVDKGIIGVLWLVQQVIPDFRHFFMEPYVANRFDVDWNAALKPSIAVTLAYLVPCLLLGYYSLRLRELEAK